METRLMLFWELMECVIVLQRHDACADQEPTECTCGTLKDHILPPWAVYPVIKVESASTCQHTYSTLTPRQSKRQPQLFFVVAKTFSLFFLEVQCVDILSLVHITSHFARFSQSVFVLWRRDKTMWRTAAQARQMTVNLTPHQMDKCFRYRPVQSGLLWVIRTRNAVSI